MICLSSKINARHNILRDDLIYVYPISIIFCIYLYAVTDIRNFIYCIKIFNTYINVKFIDF